jgi:beta-phosphoglucomutase
VFRATLFDYNGVLVDDEHVHFAAFRDVLATRGVILTEAEYWNEFLGFDDVGAFRAALDKAGQTYSDAEIRSLVVQKKPVYLALAEHTLSGFPGAAELLRARAALGPVVIVSGALRDEIEMGLTALGVRELVADIVSADDTERSKPDPQGYLMGIEALRRAGVVDPELSTVVFEDSIDGIDAACAAGLACIAIAHSYPRARLEQTGACLVVDTIAAIDEAVLEAAWSARSALRGSSARL